MADGIPVHTKESYTDSISPNVKEDVSIDRTDSLNEGAWALHDEVAKGGPEMPVHVDWSKGGEVKPI